MDDPASLAPPARIRRPRAEDFREAAVVTALREAAEIAAETSADARLGGRRLLRFAGWLLLLCAVTPPLIVGVARAVPAIPEVLVCYAGVAFFGIAFWAGCGRGPLRRRLREKRARLDEQEDSVEMRRLALQSGGEIAGWTRRED